MMRGVRGAITVEENKAEQIRNATQELLQVMLNKNSLDTEDIVSAIFTVTSDLDADFPASTARKMGWDQVPLLCMNEIPVPGALPRCIRVLLHVNTSRSQREIQHIYLREATKLRKDLLGSIEG
jgi:chorismate mutase